MLDPEVGVSERYLVYGLAVAGAAVVRALQARGIETVVADDSAAAATSKRAAELGTELIVAPSDGDLAALVKACAVVVPAPGVPETHRLFTMAQQLGRPVRSEIELAYRWEQDRPGGPRPMLAVTGTDGKTTTTMWATEMLRHGGVSTVAAGNTDVPLVEALELDVEAFVVECASFRLFATEQFRGDVALWLNQAPDHLNWHRSLASYEAAKAKVFTQQRATDVAIGNIADPVVMRQLDAAPGRHRTFGHDGADYHVACGELRGPDRALAAVVQLQRTLPHDLTNGLAASALVLESALVGHEAVTAGLASFTGPPHRIELVGEADGVRWFNDSKATTPHAASAAIRAFDRDPIVLIAGGLNKGLDLAPLAAEPNRIRAVIAIGRDAGDVARVFAAAGSGARTGIDVTTAASMADAVARAREVARSGDVVLLSPGCASFDWYPDGGYPERGDDFRRLVQARLTGAAS